MPEGTIPIAVGLVVNGVATYGFLIAAARSLGDDRYSALAVLWTIVFILGPGFFQPLEQEVSRISADRASRGAGAAPVVRRAGIIGVAIFAGLTVLLLAAGPILVRELFQGDWWLLFALIVTMGAFGVGELLRGLLSGYHRFTNYALYFGTEGLVRVVLAVVMLWLGVTHAGVFGLIVASGPAVAVVVAGRGQNQLLQPGPEVEWIDLRQALGFLLAASLFEAFLLNVGVASVNLLADDNQKEAAGEFLNGMLMARVPLFFFQAIKASLLPKLAGLAGRGDFVEFRATLFRLLAFVGFIASGGVIGAYVLGPFIVDFAFQDTIARSDMALLAVSSGLFMFVLSLALTLIALGAQRKVALGWVPGVLTYPLAFLLPIESLFLRVEAALILSIVVASASMAVLARGEVRRVRANASDSTG